VICLLVINVCFVFPSVCGYKYHSCVLVSSQHLLTFVSPCILMASSFESLGEIESSAGSIVCLPCCGGAISGRLFNESSACIPCNISTEVVGLRLLVKARERTLAERFD
jgi:hypothetical protein